MMSLPTSSRWLAAVVLLAACDSQPLATASADAEALAARHAENAAVQAAAASKSAEARDLQTLRASASRFNSYTQAKALKYDFLFLDMCMVDDSPAQLGGMGYHYVNTSLLDANVDAANPEAVMYERDANGELKLIAVEYVVPGPLTNVAPTLFGQTFTKNKYDLWVLHVWMWKENPSGLYAPWNPNVSCDNAEMGAMHH